MVYVNLMIYLLLLLENKEVEFWSILKTHDARDCIKINPVGRVIFL